LTFPSAASRELWVQSGPPGLPNESVHTEKTSIHYDLKGAKPTDTLYVWDKTTGNLARRSVKDVSAEGKWEVTDKDYGEIAQVAVQLLHDGKPVAAAQVSLDDGARRQQEFIDPSMKGEIRFFGVKPGSLKVKVLYKSEGKNAEPVTQVLEASLKRSQPVPTLKVALPESVETIGSSPNSSSNTADAPNKTAPDAAKEEPSANPVGKLLTYVIGLGLAVGLAWFAIQYFKKNPDTVGSKLEQLGVQIPKPQDDPVNTADPVVPAPIRPAPPQKIILDDAAVPDPGIAPVALASPAVTGQPRFVSESGDELPLSEGELVVGREVGLGLSLVGESTVSRKHAQVTKSGDTVVVKDLGSTNGTYVNGAKVDTETTLRPGDTVQFGSVRFRYQG
jgi:hypothetical protein